MIEALRLILTLALGLAFGRRWGERAAFSALSKALEIKRREDGPHA